MSKSQMRMDDGLLNLPAGDALLCVTGRRMVQQGLVQATAGNISILDPKTQQVWVSGSGYNLAELSGETVCRLSLNGKRLDAEVGRPSSEWPIHQAIYQQNLRVGAVIHSHPVYATACAIAHQPLDIPYVAEAMVLLGPVPVLPYCPPGSEELAQQIAQAMMQYRAVMLANHGVIVVGHDMRDAYYRLELLEATARMVMIAGERAKPLPKKHVEDIWVKYHDGSPWHDHAQTVFLGMAK